MINFINDYSEGAHPQILELLTKSNLEQNTGYGEDVHSERAKTYIRQLLGKEEADIHFIPGGTQTNLLVISSFLRPYQAVIAADTGHINVHETGAVEATGHKVITVPGVSGKLTVQGILEALNQHSGEHMVQPKMVYLSDTTELGTVYTKSELTAIHDICREHGLILFLDGARLASALTSRLNDLALQEIAKLVDVFYIGGTKNGALLGEALVILRKELREDFRYLIKQRGAMMAKGFVMGIQFEALLQPMEADGKEKMKQDNLYFELGRHANQMAEKIADALQEYGYTFYAPACSNQLFPILPDSMLTKLSEEFGFLVQTRVDDTHSVIRLVTSWATKEEHVEKLIRFLSQYNNLK